MKRIAPNVAEFTETELLVLEIHQLLMDQGHDPNEAINIIYGNSIPRGLRSETPLLDEVLTPPFLSWMRGLTST